MSDVLEKKGPIKKIGVIGMGYVGIPAAALFAELPNIEKVYGFQRDSPSSGYKIEMLNRGESPLKGEEPGLAELIKKVVDAGKFEATSDFSKIGQMDAVTLAIQTPFKDAQTEGRAPDFSALIAGLEQVGKYLQKGMLVVLESTITPGTTKGLAKKVLEKASGLKAGEDFTLAHAPERVMVGRLIRNIQEHDRIVGGIDKKSTERAVELYEPVLTKGKIIAMNATAAETTKTAENTFRDLQLAAVNELALYCEAMGINVYDVRDGIDSLKGEGITRAILYPGAGVGGHCLTKDTYHLEKGAKDLGVVDYPEGKGSLYVLAREINDFMPRHMIHLTEAALEKAGKKIDASKIAILGWAFLNDSDDYRNTPAEPYKEMAEEKGAEIAIHDPHVRSYEGIEIETDVEKVLEGADVIVVFAGHKQYFEIKAGKAKALMKERPSVIDGRNVLEPDEWIDAGYSYKGIGRGDKNSH